MGEDSAPAGFRILNGHGRRNSLLRPPRRRLTKRRPLHHTATEDPQEQQQRKINVVMNSGGEGSSREGEDKETAVPWYERDSHNQDMLVTAITADGSLSAKAISATNLVSEFSRFQGLSGLAAAAVGRAIMCTALIADGSEEEENFQVKFRGDGPIKGVMAMSNGRLETSGYAGNPNVVLPLNEKGKFDVGGAIGKGNLEVVRWKKLPGNKFETPYQSITQLRSGEVPEDINWYLCESEQKQGALAAGVFVKGTDSGVDLNGEHLTGAFVDAAGGWYVQVLPFADEATISILEKNLQALASRSPTTMLREGLGPEDIIKLLLDGMEPQILSHRSVPSLAESCKCSNEVILRTLKLLPRAEIDEILEKNGQIEVKCEFCGKRYVETSEGIRVKL